MADVSPWGGWSPGAASISPEFMAMVNAGNSPDTVGPSVYSPTGQYMLGVNQMKTGGTYDPATQNWIDSYSPMYSIYDATEGPGSPIYQYGASGQSLGTRAGAGIMSPIAGVGLVAGAALGAQAAFGSGGAAGAGAGTAGATTPTSFGVLDPAVAPVGGVSYGGVAPGSFSIGSVEPSMFSGGVSMTPGGGMTFGAVDPQVYNAGQSIMNNGGAVTPGASGADMDQFYQGNSTLGGGATASSPSSLAQAMQLLSSGGISPEFIKQAVFGSGGLGFSAMNGGQSGMLGYAQPLMQLYSALEGRKRAKQLGAQLGTIANEATLPDPTDVTKLPGFQTGLEAVQRSMAAQGYQGSGNMMAALARYGGDFYNQAVGQRLASARTRADITNAMAGPVTGQMSSNAMLAYSLPSILRLAGMFL